MSNLAQRLFVFEWHLDQPILMKILDLIRKVHGETAAIKFSLCLLECSGSSQMRVPGRSILKSLDNLYDTLRLFFHIPSPDSVHLRLSDRLSSLPSLPPHLRRDFASFDPEEAVESSEAANQDEADEENLDQATRDDEEIAAILATSEDEDEEEQQTDGDDEDDDEPMVDDENDQEPEDDVDLDDENEEEDLVDQENGMIEDDEDVEDEGEDIPFEMVDVRMESAFSFKCIFLRNQSYSVPLDFADISFDFLESSTSSSSSSRSN